jgi:hypothetical protein
MEKLPINWRIISNPLNWVTVTLMFLIAGIGYKMIAHKVTEGNK